MGSDDSSNNRVRNGVFHCNPLCPRRVGSHYLLWGHVDTGFPLQAMVGPDWPCMIASYVLIIGGSFLVMAYVIPDSGFGKIGQLVELCLMLSTCLCFSCAGCSDPGIVFKELYNVHDMDDEFSQVETGAGAKQPKNRCMHCDVIRGPRASHCYDCDLCISELDHHCPWTGKCIGQKTLKNFYMFLTSLCGLIIFSIVCVFSYVTGPFDTDAE
mmetsp:Transcript_12394/g.22558  ORF Transcript_12394/g.22558 Transcript_12394/m.22558 type:complete len:212 (-) Transcript_12394:92-727(-)